ncbi:hypothetical protein HDU67_000872, partial [Dinochytrium kinnereticum]
MASPPATTAAIPLLETTATALHSAATHVSNHTLGNWDALVPEDRDLQSAHLLYLLLGAFICLFGLFSLVIKEKLYMSEAMFATVFGAIIGPFVLKYFDPLDRFGPSLNHVTLEVSRVVIAVQVMACGIDLPAKYLWKEGLSMFMLIVPNMIIKWVVSALGVYWIVGVPYLEALVIAACLTPTDPVLANSIVKGKFAERHIPENVRLILSAE